MTTGSRLAFVGIILTALAGCESARSTPIAPTSIAPVAAVQSPSSPGVGTWGAASSARMVVASESSAFPCALGPFGLAQNSHYILSGSGNESLVCSGHVSVPPPDDGATILTDFPCTLPSGTITLRSQFVLTPSGHATLTCQSK